MSAISCSARVSVLDHHAETHAFHAEAAAASLPIFCGKGALRAPPRRRPGSRRQDLSRHQRQHRQVHRRAGITAPPGLAYVPPWQPPAERSALDLAESGITSIVCCIGFSPDVNWLDAPFFYGRGHPQHQRGVTRVPGLYFLGLPWPHTWGSGRFSGVARDALYLAERIEAGRQPAGAAQPQQQIAQALLS